MGIYKSGAFSSDIGRSYLGGCPGAALGPFCCIGIEAARWMGARQKLEHSSLKRCSLKSRQFRHVPV
jgi:hypothetical protein